MDKNMLVEETDKINIKLQTLYNDNRNTVQNSQEEEMEDDGSEELTLAEIEQINKIREDTLLRSEKYTNLISEKQSKNTFPDNIAHTSIDIKKMQNSNNYINPNKERLFSNYHTYYFIKGEPLIVLGPNINYYVIIISLVSFISIILYSWKNNDSSFFKIIYIFSYFFFVIMYTLLLIINPGIPSDKSDFDINDLNINYSQCAKCNCISYNNPNIKCYHCDECGICIEGREKHFSIATKCVGKKNKKIFYLWIASVGCFAVINLIYLIF